MTVNEVLVHLEQKGDEAVRKRNSKSGAGSNQYGVKMGDIRALANKIKSNHELGLALWATGNLEARLLSILIVKPNQLSANELEGMAHQLDFGWLADWFNAYLVKDHPERELLRERWMESNNPWVARSGWSLMAGKIARDAEGIDIDGLLQRIAAEMPTTAPEAQWTMNTALAYIGIHHPNYRIRAIQLGEAMGIYRNYPVSKGCTSPFAPIWINEMVSRQTK